MKEEDLEENYAAYTVTDLKKLAKKKKIKGYTSMKKADLIKAIKSHK
ncbi:MAG: Rho termination factor N-terminal domain-containing protein [Bacilli bacterium]